MSPRARLSAFVLVLVALVLGILFQPSGREFTESSFGVTPRGHGAVLELLRQLEIAATRNYAPSSALPESATLWWVGAPGICDDLHGAAWPGTAWLGRGGTAVVFLEKTSLQSCESIAGRRLPLRTDEKPAPLKAPREHEAILQAARATPMVTPSHGRLDAGSPNPNEAVHIRSESLLGELGEYNLDSPGLDTFDEATEPWHVAASLAGKAFVIEQVVGDGRLVVVADDRFLLNELLARADNAVFAVGLAQIFGTPLLDERQRGFRRHDSALLYLLESSALPLFLSLILLGLLFMWQGRALPRRSVVELDRRAPVLGTFVDSLAALYRRSDDLDAVLAAYRVTTLARLRRALRLRHDARDHVLLTQLARSHRLGRDDLRALKQSRPIRDLTQLRAEAEHLDRIFREVAGNE